MTGRLRSDGGGVPYKNHVGIDRRHRLIRSWAATDASRHDGKLLPALIDKDNTASDVWARYRLSLQSQ